MKKTIILLFALWIGVIKGQVINSLFAGGKAADKHVWKNYHKQAEEQYAKGSYALAMKNYEYALKNCATCGNDKEQIEACKQKLGYNDKEPETPNTIEKRDYWLQRARYEEGQSGDKTKADTIYAKLERWFPNDSLVLLRKAAYMYNTQSTYPKEYYKHMEALRLSQKLIDRYGHQFIYDLIYASTEYHHVFWNTGGMKHNIPQKYRINKLEQVKILEESQDIFSKYTDSLNVPKYHKQKEEYGHIPSLFDYIKYEEKE